MPIAQDKNHSMHPIQSEIVAHYSIDHLPEPIKNWAVDYILSYQKNYLSKGRQTNPPSKKPAETKLAPAEQFFWHGRRKVTNHFIHLYVASVIKANFDVPASSLLKLIDSKQDNVSLLIHAYQHFPMLFKEIITRMSRTNMFTDSPTQFDTKATLEILKRLTFELNQKTINSELILRFYSLKNIEVNTYILSKLCLRKEYIILQEILDQNKSKAKSINLMLVKVRLLLDQETTRSKAISFLIDNLKIQQDHFDISAGNISQDMAELFLLNTLRTKVSKRELVFAICESLNPSLWIKKSAIKKMSDFQVVHPNYKIILGIFKAAIIHNQPGYIIDLPIDLTVDQHTTTEKLILKSYIDSIDETTHQSWQTNSYNRATVEGNFQSFGLECQLSHFWHENNTWTKHFIDNEINTIMTPFANEDEILYRLNIQSLKSLKLNLSNRFENKNRRRNELLDIINSVIKLKSFFTNTSERI